MQGDQKIRFKRSARGGLVSSFSLHKITTNLTRVSYISFPVLIYIEVTQRGGIHKQPPRKSAYLTSTTSVGMPLMPERVTTGR